MWTGVEVGTKRDSSGWCPQGAPSFTGGRDTLSSDCTSSHGVGVAEIEADKVKVTLSSIPFLILASPQEKVNFRSEPQTPTRKWCEHGNCWLFKIFSF